MQLKQKGILVHIQKLLKALMDISFENEQLFN